MASICVFCGSQSGDNPVYTESTRQLARVLVELGHTIVYGGGSVGLMGTLADTALDGGGHVVGVIPEALARVELMHTGVADMRVVKDMHVRKATMHELADAYIALPGGYGTMEELFEVLCWAQLDFHTAPVAILNDNGFYDGLKQQIDNMVHAGFLNGEHRQLLEIVPSVQQLHEWLQMVSGK